MSSLKRTAIMMSRLPRLIDPQSTWLSGLRAAVRRVQQQGDVLVIVPGTAGADYVRRAAERLTVRVELIADDTKIHSEVSDDSDQIPPRDRSLMLAADTVLVLGIRTNGNVHHALCERLANGGTVELADLADLQSRSVREDLIGRGASLWLPSHEDQSPLRSHVASHPRRTADGVIEIVPFPSASEWTYLSHTTRACAGPWPGQQHDEYFDSLLNGTDDGDHSPVAALKRIVAQRRLIASRRTIRAGHAMVCLTAVPLLKLPALHQFRAHRVRWDFEPYGLCIHRKWLEKSGARPVIYGDDAVWTDLAEADRPFFQLNRSISAAAEPSTARIDWSIEQEWRHAGDLDLTDLPADQALVFVPHFEAATRLAAVSPWPLTLWPDPSIAT